VAVVFVPRCESAPFDDSAGKYRTLNLALHMARKDGRLPITTLIVKTKNPMLFFNNAFAIWVKLKACKYLPCF
jgi:hypothetical protein